MVSIDTSLPFKVKGFNFDPANAFAAAQQTKGQILTNEARELGNRGAEMQNAMSGMQLEEATGQFNAMKNYRDRLAAGDANATDALSSYPEIQLKVGETLDALDDQERTRTVAKAKDVAEAARRVLSYPDGPERVKAWNSELDRLVSEGDITKEWADEHRDNVSQEDLDDTLRMGETIDEYIARKDAAAKLALEERKARPQTEDDLTLSQKLEITKAATDRVRAISGNSFTPLDPARIKEEEAAIMRQLGIQPSKQTVTPPPTEGGEALGLGAPGDAVEPEKAAPSTAPGESPDSPAKPTTEEEFNALPVGAWFTNPADGRILQKVE